jgi:two-component system NarL family sensor kinase
MDAIRQLAGARTLLVEHRDGGDAPGQPDTWEVDCGAPGGDALVLRAGPPEGGFHPREERLLFDVARVVGDHESRRIAERRDAEIARHHERQRIADDLHDDVSQLLFAARLALNGTSQPDISGARELLQRAEVALREAIFVLASAPEPLSEQITRLVAAARAQWSVEIAAQVDPELDAIVSSECARELSRAAAELLANAGKHAPHAQVRLKIDQVGHFVELTVVDNGTPPRQDLAAQSPAGHGLRALQRRATEYGGNVTVSRSQRGTRVVLRLPLDDPLAETAL